MANKVTNFTTTVANEDILLNTNVKALIKERLGIKTDSDYISFLNNKGLSISFRIRFASANNRVSINNGIYSECEGHWYLNEEIDYFVHSIKVLTPESARFAFLII